MTTAEMNQRGRAALDLLIPARAGDHVSDAEVVQVCDILDCLRTSLLTALSNTSRTFMWARSCEDVFDA